MGLLLTFKRRYMCTGRELKVDGAETEQARENKITSDAGWSSQKICDRRT